MKTSMFLVSAVAAGLAIASVAPAAFAEDMKKDTKSKELDVERFDGQESDVQGQNVPRSNDKRRHVEGQYV